MFLLQQATHRMVVRHHEQIGHLYVPNLRARIPSERGGYYVRTNAQGFRSDLDFEPKRSSGRPRILFFGDSFTAGDGCDNSERFSELVGEALDAEVYNYGLSGSGTDQQLLIFEQFAGEIEADLIVLAVAVLNIERNKAQYRESIDRVTGQNILVPKPYFTLEESELRLHNVPVPRERPLAEGAGANKEVPHTDLGMYKLYERYRTDPRLAAVRKRLQPVVGGLGAEIRTRSLKLRRFQPFPDYDDANSTGWRLMRAILERFLAQRRHIPVLLAPIPVYYYYMDELEPSYQARFAELADPAQGVHVADLTSPLLKLARADRKRLSFVHDAHFSPFGHQQFANLIAAEITRRNLLPLDDGRWRAMDDGRKTAMDEGRKAKDEASSPQPPEPGTQNPEPSTQNPEPSTQHAARSTKYILGISAFYHNSAAALIKDGQIVAAAEEERFSRIKNDRRFPHQAANYCLEEAGIQQHDLAAVVYYDNAWLTFERILHTHLAVDSHTPNGEDAWLRVTPSWVRYKLHLPQLIRRYLRYDGPILHEVHHRSHAASAFFCSPFDRAAILTIDGVGEWATATIGVGRGKDIQLLKEMHFPHSLGLLYSAFTQFTGFKVNSGEYKMMGLAPYGQPKYVDLILENLVDLKEDGSVELNLDYFAYLSEPTMTNARFADLFGGPARKPDDRISQREMDMARSIQVVTEEAMLRMARHAHKLTGETRLCLAGGVALNCVANGRILRESPFDDIWIQPAAGDAGCALGAALDAYHTYFDQPRILSADGRPLQRGSLLGPEFSPDEIEAFLQTYGYPAHKLDSSARAGRIASYLEAGKVVGHFAGRLEFGPRALGARSIIGDARNSEMQANLNLKIKYRESFRPFAPTVLAERVSDFFELDRESPYMLLVAPVKKERQLPFERGDGSDMLEIVRKLRSDVPAITHVDYSARIQSIFRADHPPYYDAIKAFEQRTGYGIIVNTSFNVRGEPIICTPQDAYRCFMGTEMDVLALGDYLLLKEEQPAWTGYKGHIETDGPGAGIDMDDPLIQALRQIYLRHLLPVARRVEESAGGLISVAFKRQRSMWFDVLAAQTPAAIFAIDSALDSLTPDPAQASAAMTRYWTPGPATEALQPVMRDLIALKQRFPQADEEVARIPDSIYVMY